MRKWIVLAGLFALGCVYLTSIVGWWAQPLEVFFGRREFWWDAEDFVVFYAAGTLIADGQIAQLYDPAAHAAIQMPLLVAHEEPLGFYNPPLFGLLFVPFSALPFDVAFQAWTLVNAALVIVGCALLWRACAPLDVWYRCAFLVGFLTLYPLTFSLRLGQFSLILLISWAAAYLLMVQGRTGAAGWALSPLLIKPELLIPVTAFLAWKGQWAVLRTLLPISAAAVMLSIAMIGVPGAIDYALHIARAAGDGTGNMYGWNGLISSVVAPDDPGSMTFIALPASLLTLGGVAYLWRGELSQSSGRFPLQWLALTIGTILWDAHLYLQDLIIIVPAAAALLASTSGWHRSLAGVAIVIGWMVLGLGSRPSADWGINVFSAYMVLSLLGIVVWDSVQSLRLKAGDQPQPCELEAKAA
jgi:hypothetical protein